MEILLPGSCKELPLAAACTQSWLQRAARAKGKKILREPEILATGGGGGYGCGVGKGFVPPLVLWEPGGAPSSKGLLSWGQCFSSSDC